MNILKDTAHRPFPLPSNRWILKQSWRNISFFHWPISASQLRPFVPKQLTIDTYHGQAWVGMIVFNMANIHLRGFPKFSLTPSFSEVNIRTYVTYNGVPGICFLSIDVDNWASRTIAKRWYRLPYHSSNISLEQLQQSYYYESIRNGQSHIKAEGSIKPLPDTYTAEKESLDYWLMERYRLYSNDRNSRLFKADIHHKPWSLKKAESEIYRNGLLSKFDLNVNELSPAVAHFSKGIDTLFWQIRKA